MKIALIVAVAENKVIGRDNQLPWRLPKDLQYFKQQTTGKILLMGRKTFDSIGSPLANRTSIVVTRNKNWQYLGERSEYVHRAGALKEGISIASELCAEDNEAELMVIGGAQIYAAALPVAQRLYLTQVHAQIEGDAYFPEWHQRDWREIFRQDWPADARNPYPYSFIILDRIER